MVEREYSFKAKNLNECLKFCDSNNFSLSSSTEQFRTIYRKSDKTMARITEDITGDNSKFTLDFKEDKLNKSNEALTIRKESKALEFYNIEAVASILDFLEYKKDNVLHRKRWVYIRDKVVCEIDLYDNKDQTIVVSIEGEDYTTVDSFYLEFIKNVEVIENV